MLDIRRILCPVDFSDASRHACDHAVVIAGWYGSSITALHVCNPVFPTEPPILLTLILEIAENEETDLIVMGVRGRNALDLMLFGSTTNQVVRRASCPVVTLKQ